MAKMKTQDTDANRSKVIVRANVDREVAAAPTFVSLYSNDTQVQVSPWDVRLIFGMITQPPSAQQPSPTIHVTQVGEVRMSPQHAKKVVQILLAQIQGYEERIGPIPLPGD
jgi:hypothetical protein